jgi:cellulose synthase/poly-beta-1,6-N-acetylglucosamine synthase-like glycosyltransferase
MINSLFFAQLEKWKLSSMDLILLFIMSFNLISVLFLIIYPINLLFLALSSRKWADPTSSKKYGETELPYITLQLPVYNESRVIQTTLENLLNMQYPFEKLKIQILDDSTDNTSDLINEFIKRLREEVLNVEVIRRDSREGFKAGALRNGLVKDDSEFVALFDSDFKIDPFFLIRSIHYFKNNDTLGAVQARWGHTNMNHSLFTRAMSIGLDGHFLVEKIGRKRLKAYISFNGTGGIWRRVAIDESGGWSSDTLAEDLDLAFRSQLKGYEIIYLTNVINYQEVPPTIRCWIIQQSRWAKGFSQNLRKNFRRFLISAKGEPRFRTFQGIIHLTQYFVPLMIVINTITSTYLFYIPEWNADVFVLFGFLFSFAAICGIAAYAFAIIRARRSWWDILLIPLFLFWGAGLIIRMGVGVIDGLMRKGGIFERTPKFNLKKERIVPHLRIREHIPLDKIILLEIIYILILVIGIFKTLSLGGGYIFTGLYYIFIVLSMINLVLSEIRHALS